MKMGKLFAARVAVVALAGLPLAACGSSTTTPTPVTNPTPAAPVKTTLASGSFSGLGQYPVDYLRVLLTVGQTGTVDLSTDWTYGDDSVGLFLGQGDCLGNLNCPALGQNTSNAKPKTLTVTNVPPGTYSLLIVNYGPRNESVSYQAFLTR